MDSNLQHISPLLIRRALPSDAERLLPLVQEFATSFSVKEKGFRTIFSDILALDHLYLAIAEISDEIVGYVLGTAHPTLYASGSVAWVEEIMVRKEERLAGVGRRLMEHFEEWAQSRNSRLVALATRRAADFYRALGYEESATYYRKVKNP